MSRYVPYFRRQPSKEAPSGRPVALITAEPAPPNQFRVQVYQDIDYVLGVSRGRGWTRARNGADIVCPADIWEFILEAVAHEYGFFAETRPYNSAASAFKDWLLGEDRSAADVLTGIELAFKIAKTVEDAIQRYQDEYRSLMTVADAVADVNDRFGQHRLPYQLDPESLLIRNVDSEFLNAVVITPALTLIRKGGFKGAEAEFNKALEHHRHGRHEEAINEALKAFESVMKQICEERGWSHEPHHTASKLIATLLENGIAPGWSQEQLTQLRKLLESGTPTVRNKESGHGDGATPRPVPARLAAYALHTAAANIVLLVEAHTA